MSPCTVTDRVVTYQYPRMTKFSAPRWVYLLAIIHTLDDGVYRRLAVGQRGMPLTLCWYHGPANLRTSVAGLLRVLLVKNASFFIRVVGSNGEVRRPGNLRVETLQWGRNKNFPTWKTGNICKKTLQNVNLCEVNHVKFRMLWRIDHLATSICGMNRSLGWLAI